MTPHRQLLADYAESGSEEAFRELVTAYLGLVHGSALRLVNGNSQLAEDISQTVFTDLAHHAKKLSPEVMIGGWLHRRTCYAAATAMRSERRRLIREQVAAEMNALNSADSHAELALIAPVLDEAINQLAKADRAAITLRFFEHLNIRDIGGAMGTSEAAAQKRVERALEKLRRLLQRRGIVLPVAALALALGSASATAAPAGMALTISSAALTSAPASTGFTLTTLKIMAITKLKLTVTAAVVALLTVGTVTTIVLHRDPGFTPPSNPNPQEILNEAQADTAAGRYPQALAKHIWYRDNALKYQPAQAGVRDSFALSYWAELAEKYPPAMAKLTALRDDAIKQLEAANTGEKAALSAYITAVSINNGFKAETNNVELFKWLDSHNPAAAKRVYSVAERDLIQAGEYALCGRYMDPERSYKRLLDMYTMAKKTGNDHLMEFSIKSFSNQSARLVAVLALNNRNTEAERVASQAASEIHDPEFTALLAEAKNGKVPDAWP